MRTNLVRGKVTIRLLAALAVPVAALTAATPAGAQQAAPTPRLLCEGGGGQWDCHLLYAVPISWWINGRHATAFDMRSHASGRCGTNERVGVKVYFYTDRLGELGRSVLCPPDLP